MATKARIAYRFIFEIFFADAYSGEENLQANDH